MEDNTRVISAVIKTDLSSFIHKVFDTINPGAEYYSNWHINLIAEHLRAVEAGEIKRLIINMPPRALKSMCISIAWPAWLLAHNPSYKIMVASYSQILSTKLSLDTRFVMNAEWYKKLFPKTKLHPKQNQKNKFMTTKYGFRFATSVGGSATGEGGDILIIDDPHNPTQIASEKARDKVMNWYMETFSTRLNNRKDGKIVIVMQRLHDEDLTGFLTTHKGDEWTVLKIPTIASSNINYNFNNFSHNMKMGDSIHDILFHKDNIDQLIKEIGLSNFQTQYQQEPKSKSAGLLNTDHLKYYTNLPSNFTSIIQSWDTAIKISDTSDYSACTIWGILDDCYYLIACIANKYEYPQLKTQVKKLYNKYSPEKILIEDKSSGQSLIQDLKFEGTKNIIPCKAIKDKITRFATCLDLFEAGRVFIPAHSNFTEKVKEQLLNFPNVEHDDIVDSISQFLNYTKTYNNLLFKPRIREV